MVIRNEVINADSTDSTSEKSIIEPLNNSLEDNRLTFENDKTSSTDYIENNYNTIISEFLLELREKLNVITAATCFIAEKINHLLKTDRRIFQKMLTDNLDKNINLNYEVKTSLNSSSPFQRACEKFTGQKSLSQFIRNKPKLAEPVEFNLGVDKGNKSDSIQHVPILSTPKVLLEHEDVLGSVLDQGNDNEGDARLRTFKDGTAYRRNELFSVDKN